MSDYQFFAAQIIGQLLIWGSAYWRLTAGMRRDFDVLDKALSRLESKLKDAKGQTDGIANDNR